MALVPHFGTHQNGCLHTLRYQNTEHDSAISTRHWYSLTMKLIVVFDQHEDQQNVILVSGTKCQGETRPGTAEAGAEAKRIR